MKPQMRILPIAVAVAMVIALIMTAALMGMSYFSEAQGQQSTDTREEITAAHTESITRPRPSDTTAVPPTEETSVTDEPESGLLYRSYGDGTCILVGVGNCRDACVVIPEFSPDGDRVVEIAPHAFYGCNTVTAIQIPRSVRLIGSLAFAACNNLVFLSVNESNPYYLDRDGVLFTADETELLLYPPRRAGNYILLSDATVKIHDMAFYNCLYLQSVHYTGSAEQWERISIGTKNYSLTAAAKTFGGN